MTAAPKREEILSKLGLTGEEMVKEKAGAFLALIEPIVADIIKMMDELGTNFPDTV